MNGYRNLKKGGMSMKSSNEEQVLVSNYFIYLFIYLSILLSNLEHRINC